MPRLTSRAARGAVAKLVVAAFVVSIATACGGGSGNRVDVGKLEDELTRVVYQVKHAEGFDYEVRVACSPGGGDALRFTCHVDATTPGRPGNSWDETVTCRPPAADVPRCASASGYALQ